MPNGMTGGVLLDGCNTVTTLPQTKIKDFCQLPLRGSRRRSRAGAPIQQPDKQKSEAPTAAVVEGIIFRFLPESVTNWLRALRGKLISEAVKGRS